MTPIGHRLFPLNLKTFYSKGPWPSTAMLSIQNKHLSINKNRVSVWISSGP